MLMFSHGCLDRPVPLLVRSLLACAAFACLAGCNAPVMGPGHMGEAVMNFGAAAPQLAPNGGGVAVLAPLTGADAAIGPALVNAARLGLGTGTVPPIAVFDTGSTAAGAAAAAQQAVAGGASLILGPLTATEANAVAPTTTTAHVDVLAFTSDGGLARPGFWPLGITAAEQVAALLRAAHAAGNGEVAALLPLTPLGEAMAQALRSVEPSARIQLYRDFVSMNASVRTLSDYVDRRGPVDARIKALQSQHTEAALAEASRLARQPIPPPPFNALLIAETGSALDEVASLLPYYDIDPGSVLILGPGLWAADPAGVAAAGFSSALYAAPEPAAAADFTSRYELQFDSTPPVLAGMAFDAGAIARLASQAGRLDLTVFTNPAGFGGADGVLALRPDGSVRRGLAVFRAMPGGAQIVQPAPTALPAPLL